MLPIKTNIPFALIYNIYIFADALSYKIKHLFYNMIRHIYILFICTFSVLPTFAQRNYAQELINLMEQGKCFEARDLREKYPEYLPLNDKAYDLVYKSNMAIFFNKTDSISIYLEDLTTNYESAIGPGIGPYYGKLLQMYDDTQQFEKGIKLCDKIIYYFNRNPFGLAPDLVQNEIRQMENAKSSFEYRNANDPRRRVERTSNKNAFTKLKDNNYIQFDAIYNGVPVQTWFDTGVSFYLITTKNVAKEIGVKIVDKDTPKFMNGVQTEAWAGIIDSIDLKSVKLYNIPVLIHDGYVPNAVDTLASDAKSKLDSIRSIKQVIMGLPLMKMIGKFEFDWEKRTVRFPQSKRESAIGSSSNIYINNNNLYQLLEINGLNYVGHVDTGDDDFVNITYSFYEKNKSHIEIDSVAEKKPINHIRATGIFFNVPYEIVKGPKIYSNSEIVNPDTCRVLITEGTLFHLNSFDGTIGAGLFKHLGSKVIFDFDNMDITGESSFKSFAK